MTGTRLHRSISLISQSKKINCDSRAISVRADRFTSFNQTYWYLLIVNQRTQKIRTLESIFKGDKGQCISFLWKFARCDLSLVKKSTLLLAAFSRPTFLLNFSHWILLSSYKNHQFIFQGFLNRNFVYFVNELCGFCHNYQGPKQHFRIYFRES